MERAPPVIHIPTGQATPQRTRVQLPPKATIIGRTQTPRRATSRAPSPQMGRAPSPRGGRAPSPRGGKVPSPPKARAPSPPRARVPSPPRARVTQQEQLSIVVWKSGHISVTPIESWEVGFAVIPSLREFSIQLARLRQILGDNYTYIGVEFVVWPNNAQAYSLPIGDYYKAEMRASRPLDKNPNIALIIMRVFPGENPSISFLNFLSLRYLTPYDDFEKMAPRRPAGPAPQPFQQGRATSPQVRAATYAEITEATKLLAKYKITDRGSWKRWLVQNHPDKNPDTTHKLITEINNSARILGYQNR